MFEDLQKLFRESVAAFRSEFDRREPEDEVAHLLGSMRRELVEARALVPKLEEDLAATRRELAAEREHLTAAERRGKLAEGIGDGETVKVAAEFAGKHRERAAVLEQKAAALESELALRRREADAMMAQYKEADANRWKLVAELKRGQSAERIRSVADDSLHSFDEFDRMAGKIDDLEQQASVDERLAELKRKMGRDG